MDAKDSGHEAHGTPRIRWEDVAARARELDEAGVTRRRIAAEIGMHEVTVCRKLGPRHPTKGNGRRKGAA